MKPRYKTFEVAAKNLTDAKNLVKRVMSRDAPFTKYTIVSAKRSGKPFFRRSGKQPMSVDGRYLTDVKIKLL